MLIQMQQTLLSLNKLWAVVTIGLHVVVATVTAFAAVFASVVVRKLTKSLYTPNNKMPDKSMIRVHSII